MNNETVDGDVKNERESCGDHKREGNFLGSKVYFERIDEGLEERRQDRWMQIAMDEMVGF
jgi:hypothetical protein